MIPEVTPGRREEDRGADFVYRRDSPLKLFDFAPHEAYDMTYHMEGYTHDDNYRNGS